ncbi:MAG: glutathione peroxidase [Coriobacteriales bacterium]|jgi:glutathione peroxidase
MGIYDYKVKAQDGSTVSLGDYSGKVLLIVNTATQCGFTPQYDDLEALYSKYRDKGFEILDFPCNQFGGQAPGSDEEIHSFCTLKFGTEFPQFSKIEVNGPGEDPLYTYLKEQQPFKGFGEGRMAEAMGKVSAQLDPDWANNSKIKWNFTKFLVDRKGNVVERFEPIYPIADIDAKVSALL